ncbi:MAG TPA: SRPBCC family protein, partial [Longimicrobiales bacterium]|nr:SRPBCC family protein [Longimicrobiales bacterium]
MTPSPISPGTRILAGGALVLGLFLAVGFLLPGTWSAERTTTLHAPPETVFPLVDAPRAWRRWTAWPDSGLVAQGPDRGAGARLVWDDPELGDGSFEIVAVEPLRSVRYEVRVQGGGMHTDGTFLLEPEGAGTRVTWREEGDFGRNPLMGYWARFMARAQGRELEKAL